MRVFLLLGFLFAATTSQLTAQRMDSMRAQMLKKFSMEQTLRGKIGQPIPTPLLRSLSGQTLSISEFSGRPTVLNFWFSSCAPCIAEMPDLNKLVSIYRDSVHFVAITFEDSTTVSDFLQTTDFNFSHIIEARPLIDSISIPSYPKTLLLDADLNIHEIFDAAPNVEVESDGNHKWLDMIKTRINFLLRH